MRRGGRKRPVPKGCPYGKPKTSGMVNEMKPVRNLQSIAEASYNSMIIVFDMSAVMNKSEPFFVLKAFTLARAWNCFYLLSYLINTIGVSLSGFTYYKTNSSALITRPQCNQFYLLQLKF